MSSPTSHACQFGTISFDLYIFSGERLKFIPLQVTMLIADGCPKVWVVSSDTFHQHAAYGAVGFRLSLNLTSIIGQT